LIVIDTSTPSIQNDTFMADELKKLVGCEVLLVGRHVTYAPKETLLRFCKHVNIVARNYFWQQVLDLLEGKEIEKIKGISYKEDGEVKHNLPAGLPKGEFPFVSEIYKEQLNLRKYFYASMKYPYILVNYQFGCCWNCSFCNELLKAKFFARPIDNVIEELKFIQREMPWVKSVLWDDPTFVINEDKICELCNEIIDNKIKLHFGCATRANISKETLKIMRRANFTESFHIGLETLDQEGLDKFIHKGMSINQELEYLKNCKEVGIRNHGCFILGLETDTNEKLKANLEFIKRLPAIDSIQVFPLIPTPFENIFGNEAENTAWNKVKKYLIPEVWDNGEIDYSKWLKPNGKYNCVISYPWLTKEQIEAWIERYYKEFYFRPKYIVYKIKQSMNFAELQRNFMAFKSFLL